MTNSPSPFHRTGRPAPAPLPASGMEAAADLGRIVGRQYTMPTTLDAYFQLYARDYLRYAGMMLDDPTTAKALVRRLFGQLAVNWDAVLLEENVEAFVWRLLKQRVETHLLLTGHLSHACETASLRLAARAMLDEMREWFRTAESTLGLYAAIAALPERQFDTIVLMHVLGYPSEKTASIMGIAKDTVRGHRRTALERIALKLGLPTTEHREKE